MKRKEVLMIKTNLETISEEEYLSMLDDVSLYDEEEIDESDIEEERIFECLRKK